MFVRAVHGKDAIFCSMVIQDDTSSLKSQEDDLWSSLVKYRYFWDQLCHVPDWDLSLGCGIQFLG